MNWEQLRGRWRQLVAAAKARWDPSYDDSVKRAEAEARRFASLFKKGFGDAKQATETQGERVEPRPGPWKPAGLDEVGYGDARQATEKEGYRPETYLNPNLPADTAV